MVAVRARWSCKLHMGSQAARLWLLGVIISLEKMAKSLKAVLGTTGFRVRAAKSRLVRRFAFGLKIEPDFERVDLEAVIHPAGHFILIPTAVLMRGGRRPKTLEKVGSPLAFHHDYQSKFWKSQIAARRKECAGDVSWAGHQIRRIVDEHRHVDTQNVHEADLLRAAGALSVLGLDLSLYLCKGYDCPVSRFSFNGLPAYTCPVEIKKRSSSFSYQITRYTKLPRAVVMCMEHDLINPPDHIDVLELSTLAHYLGS